MNENNKTENQPCCGGDDCCPPENDKSKLKSVVFFTVIFLALSLTAYALFFRPDEIGKPGCDPGAVVEPLEELSTVPGLRERLHGYDFALVFFSGSNENTYPDAMETLEMTFTSIFEKSPNSVLILLYPEDPVYNAANDHYIITGYPAVMVLGRYGERLLIGSSIKEETIIKAHGEVTNPPAACCEKNISSGIIGI